MREVADSTFLLGAAGAAFAVTGIGIAAGSRWAGTAGLICALVVIAASILGIGFVTFMSLGVGIGFSDPLFLQPFALFVVVIGLAISSSAVLIRRRDWFGRPSWTGGAERDARGAADERDLTVRSSRLVPIVAVALQLLLTLPYIGLTVLEVPGPLFLGFWAVWIGMFVVAVILAVRRPDVTIVVPVASVALYAIAMCVGRGVLGWGP